jgi:hypothetical protein
LFAASPALADMTKEQCIRANADGQALRLDGKLTLAREKLLSCATPGCPTIVFADCTKRAAELDRLLPTVQFDVLDKAGTAVANVHVAVDGVEVPGGTAQPFVGDPGDHTFTFTAAGHVTVTRGLALKEGQKGRVEHVTMDLSPPPVVVAPAPEAPKETGIGTRRVVALVLGGTGLASVAVGSVFGVMTFSAVSAQKADCSSTTVCPMPGAAATEHASVNSDGAISTATFVIGGALVAAGAALFFTAPHAAPEAKQSSLVIAPGVAPHGGGLALGGRF